MALGTGVESVAGASRVAVEVVGDGSGAASLTPDQAESVAGALMQASRLLTEAHAAGDPRMGNGDMEWQERETD
jgi:hypothetical protein